MFIMKKLLLLFCLLAPLLAGCRRYKYLTVWCLTKGEYYYTESEGNLPHNWVFTENSMFTLTRQTYSEQQTNELPAGSWEMGKCVFDEKGKQTVSDPYYKMVWNNTPFDTKESLYRVGMMWTTLDGRCSEGLALKNHRYEQVGDFPAVKLIYESIDNKDYNKRKLIINFTYNDEHSSVTFSVKEDTIVLT